MSEIVHQGGLATPEVAAAIFAGTSGVNCALALGSLGAAFGIAQSGAAITGIAKFRPDLTVKALIPVVMAGIVNVYGLVVAVIVVTDIMPPKRDVTYDLFQSFCHLGAGLTVGGAGVAAGISIGVVGESGVRAYMQQQRIFMGMVLILIFCEVLGLYGMIGGLLLSTKAKG